MSKPIPTIAQLYTKLSSDIKSQLGIIGALVKFVINAFSGVIAAQLKLLYLYQVDVQNNQFPDTADTAANGGTLERQGQIYLNRQPFPATAGIFTASVTGSLGALIPSGTTFKSDGGTLSPGNLYATTADYYLPGTSGVISLTALNAGASYLLNIADTLTMTAPILGVDASAAITAITTNPVDAEDPEVYRQLILNAIRLQPQGGSKTDYRLWSADADGVRTVYPYVKNGEAGTVQVYVEAVTVDSTDGKGTPSSGLLTEVAAVLTFNPDTTIPTNMRGRLPIQANLEVLPIVPIPVDVITTGLSFTNSGIVAAVLTNLIAYLYSVRPYIAGCDLPGDQNNLLTTVQLQSTVNDSIGSNNTFINFAMYVNGVQLNVFTFSLGNIPYLRNVTYA
jgi:uncharacterized phage protein gp47/JayE